MTKEQRLAEAVVFLLRKYVSETAEDTWWDCEKDKMANKIENDWDLNPDETSER